MVNILNFEGDSKSTGANVTNNIQYINMWNALVATLDSLWL